jgi:aminoglycoside phosphotransferase (APT) family kinase protein
MQYFKAAERRKKMKKLPRNEVARLLAAIFGAGSAAQVELMSEGLSNLNYKVALKARSETVVLRIYGRDPAAWQKEVDLLNLLGDTIPVPEVLHVYESGLCGIGPFIIMRYVEGISFRQLKKARDTEAIAQAAYSIGETLATLGHHKFTRCGMLGAGTEVAYQDPNGSNAIPEFIDSCLASRTLQARLEERVRERVHELAWSEAGALECLQAETSLVHGDFNNRNVLVRREHGRWRVAALLDWELAASGSQMLDISSFLQYERKLNPQREPHFSLGYLHGGGTLPEEWRQLARILGLKGQCESLTLDNLPPAIVTEIAELVRATVEDASM